MQSVVLIVHVVSAVLLVLSVLSQDKGAGLGAVFGGGGGFYATQRGAAKVLHNLTIILSVVFFVTGVLYILV